MKIISNLLGIFICACVCVQAQEQVVAASKDPGRKDLPVRIYVMVGQSNMQGKGAIEPGKGDVSGKDSTTLRYTVQNDADKEYQFLVEKDGSWRERSDVWIHLEESAGAKCGGLKPGYGSFGGQIGPELGFGHKMGDAYEGQVLLIKACWGGTSLGENFLPPSVGKYLMPPKPGTPGFCYYKILRIVKDVTTNIKTYFPDYQGQGIEIAGLCWHQGWNDQYSGFDALYEKNLVAFINDIRSTEFGLGVPNLPFVIATSGMIETDSLVKRGQLAMGDTTKYPQFAGNVAVVDTEKPYGPKKMQFKFYTEKSPTAVGYHWNNHARSYMNIGLAMAAEMQKLQTPTQPSRLVAYGTPEGVHLTWQFGTEAPKAIKLLRNGKDVEAKLSASQTMFVDTTAVPGENTYELVFDMSASPQHKLTVTSTTYVADLAVFRSVGGVTLTWNPRGKFSGYQISRDGKVIEANLSADATSYEDKQAPRDGLVTYAVQTTTGKITPATAAINLGPVDSGDALIYEPFNYFSPDFKSPVSLIGMKGAVGTVGEYFPLDETPKNLPPVVMSGLKFGDLPVMGNGVQCHAQSKGCAIALDDSLEKAGLLKDGATMWMSFVYNTAHVNGGFVVVTLQSDDLQDGIGFGLKNDELQTAVVADGKLITGRIGPVKPGENILVVGRFVWGKDGENDQFSPMKPEHDLKQPEATVGKRYPYLRPPPDFNIDQSKLKRLVFQKGGNNTIDEIRVGPTFESVVGGGTKSK